MTSKKTSLIIGISSFLAASMFLCYEMGLQVALAVVTGPLMKNMGMDAAKLGWLTGFYFIAYTFMQIPAGLLFDRFSCKKVITVACLICALGALLFIKSNNLTLMYIARFMIGAGSAFPFVGVLIVASKCFSKAWFACFVGITQFLAAFGALLGSAPLSAMVNNVGWYNAMLYTAVFGFALVAISWLFIAKLEPESTVARTSIIDSLKTIVSNKQTWPIATYAFSNWAPIIILTSLWGEPFLVEKMGITTTKAALIVQTVWIGIALGSVTIGYLSEYFKSRKPFMAVCGLLGTLASATILYVQYLSTPTMYVLFFICGIAASGQILTFAMVREIQPEEIAGTAIGFNNMAVVAGGFILQPIVGELMKYNWDGTFSNHIPHYSMFTYHKSLIIIPICFLLSFVSTYFMKQKI